ncbi:adenosylcobinamide-GDP ribazoletransferase [Aeromicrobium sp. Leaf272]|uniref:adenosylcobinamide-GDP ribazoletransferase n=1 Tax=Aeromicrobium sp. Leaf272 TaxID=1736317 RepID=UPI0006F834BD|nr:adenosylcobinamide-GDP ribazoletransferase [Aeromicrobium sp. Leaf272]KQP26696.1 cobalamin synthase [Aeromicrobium sp. Leaf272]
MTAASTVDAWRLAVGTLTAWPVRPPRTVDHLTAGRAMVLAPVAVLPLAIGATALALGGQELGLSPLATGLLVVGLLALGTRAFHLDGLADTADGLTSSYDRDRTLAVMRSGDVGPAGAAALVLVLGLQAAGAASLVAAGDAVLVGAAVLLSRSGLVVVCSRAVPAGDGSGLGATVARSVPLPVAIVAHAGWCVLLVGACVLADVPWWHGLAAAAAALVVLGLLLRRAHRRIGGVTGDVMGAGIELTLATVLVVLS